MNCNSSNFLHIHKINDAAGENDNASGALVWDRVATPFGVEVQTTGSLTQNVRFPGQYKDDETALFQNWNRDYDPLLGRYVQSDPIGLMGGVNTYAYVEGNALRLIDPTGEVVPILFGIGLSIIVDYGIGQLEKRCGCKSGAPPEIPFIYETIGGGYGAVGPFLKKPRKGFGGYGPSGNRTSWLSKHFGSATQPRGRAIRRSGRFLSRHLPYAGAAALAYDAYRLRTCL